MNPKRYTTGATVILKTPGKSSAKDGLTSGKPYTIAEARLNEYGATLIRLRNHHGWHLACRFGITTVECEMIEL